MTELLNMCFSDGKLTTRFSYTSFSDSSSEVSLEGTFHSMTKKPFCNCMLIHCGTGIYKFSGSSLSLIYTQAKNEHSLCYEMNSKVYFLSETDIIEVASDFSCTSKEPYIPTIYSNCTYDLSSFTVNEDINLLGNKVRISYPVTDYSVDFKVPLAGNTKKRPQVVYMGNQLDSTVAKFTSPTDIKLDHYNSDKNGTTVEITYELAASVITGNRKKITNCKYAESFGGSGNEGSRIFLAGNPDLKGYYFKSGLLNPTYFPELDFNIIGGGNDDITAFAKRSCDLYAFTTNSIHRIIYSFDKDSGASFPVSEVSSSVGCDMPDSVQNIDNRLVFANKNSGIYLIESTNTYDEINIKPLSKNINGEYGLSDGTFSDSSSNVFPSYDFDRKYFITSGNYIYIWDYNRTPYYDSGDYCKAQNRLAFYVFNSPGEIIKMFSVENKLFFMCKNASSSVPFIVKYDPDSGKDSVLQDSDIESYFRTKDFSFNCPHLLKKLEKISFEYSSKGSGPVIVSVFADGQEIYSYSIPCSKDVSKKRINLKIPSYLAYTYSVKFGDPGGKMSVSNLSFYFMPVSRIKNY